MSTEKTTPRDRLPSNLLVSAEVIRELRLDVDPRSGDPLSQQQALTRLKYLRAQQKLDCIRVGSRTYLYTRTGLEKFKRQNLVEAL